MTSDRSNERANERDEAGVQAEEDPVAAQRGERPQETGAESDDGGASESERGNAEGGEAFPPTGDVAAIQERYLRLAAEYDNYRKRTERERSESWVRAQADLVRRILDPLDDLQRVADVTVDSTGVEALLEGVQMVERKLLRALETAGLEVIDATGQPFDPVLHEALMTAPTDDPEQDESVGEVFQKGYGFKGILLRPARVQVRKHEG